MINITRFNRLFAVTAAAILISGGASAWAQKDTIEYCPPEENPFTISGMITSDTFFGTYPSLAGGYSISDCLDFTVYGIFWGAGNPGDTWGNWTEFGFGFAYSPTDWLTINPQIGFLGGNLLGGAALATSAGVAGDGWVPNITANLNSDCWEGQIYAGAYLPLRDQLSPTAAAPLEFLHYWGNVGRKLNDIWSVGFHHEQLLGGAGLTDASIFNWVGPYIQLRNEDQGLFVRAAAGWDVQDRGAGNTDTFWKLSTGIAF